MIVRGVEDDYDDRHPHSQDIGVVVEIAESSLEDDRRIMSRIYAREQIPEYWIVNLVDDVIEIYSQPSGPTESPSYSNRKDYPRGTSVPLVLDGVNVVEFAVNDLLP